MKLLCLALPLFVVFSVCAAADGDKCVEGHQYEESCNTCTCTSGGVYACTLRACYDGPLFPDTKSGSNVATYDGPLFPDTPLEKKVAINEPGYTCTPGAVFKEDCNTCTCDSSGTLARCTAMACDPNERHRRSIAINEPGYTCTPGAVFKDDCNTCTCNTSGTLARCTRMRCPPTPAKSSNTDESSCTPGHSWREDCNNCQCTADGLKVCTRMLCFPQEPSARRRRQLQAHGSSTQRNRNSPKKVSFNPNDPTEQPTTAASKLDAKPTQIPTTKPIQSTRRPTYERGTADRIVTENELKDPAFRCEPSLSFKLDCNTCWCATDGKSVRYCTRIACHPKTYSPLDKQ